MTGEASAAGVERDAVAVQASRARRLKSLIILAVIVWSALVFLAWSQPWFTLMAQGRAGDTVPVTVQGAVAAPALSALALAGLALSAALAIAGPVIRIVLGVLELVLGVSIVSSAVSALADPVSAGQSAVTTATGVAGASSISQIASTSGTQIWPYLAIIAGGLMAITGVVIIVTVRRWPESGRRYQPVTFQAADGRTAGNPVDLFTGDEAAAGAIGRGGDDGRPGGDDGEGDGRAGDGGADARGALDGVGVGGRSGGRVVARPVPRDVDNARTAAVDSWDSLTRGQDPTGDADDSDDSDDVADTDDPDDTGAADTADAAGGAGTDAAGDPDVPR